MSSKLVIFKRVKSVDGGGNFPMVHCHWPLSSWPQEALARPDWAVIGQYKSRDLNTGLLLGTRLSGCHTPARATVMMTLTLSWYLSPNTWYPAKPGLWYKQLTVTRNIHQGNDVRNKRKISSHGRCHDTSPQIHDTQQNINNLVNNRSQMACQMLSWMLNSWK